MSQFWNNILFEIRIYSWTLIVVSRPRWINSWRNIELSSDEIEWGRPSTTRSKETPGVSNRLLSLVASTCQSVFFSLVLCLHLVLSSLEPWNSFNFGFLFGTSTLLVLACAIWPSWCVYLILLLLDFLSIYLSIYISVFLSAFKHFMHLTLALLL